MGGISGVEEYIALHPKWAKGLSLISSMMSETEMLPTIKWNAPVYTIKGKNVVGLGAFKHHFGIWFFNGVYLSDPSKILINAQEEKTKALRQMRFISNEGLDINLIKAYVLEAIENEKAGKRLVAQKKTVSSLVIPKLLSERLSEDSNLKSKFSELSKFKQKEYCDYIDSAKRDRTKQSRLEKIIPMINSGIGLNDKYRK